MPWVRFDDQFRTHPKALKGGPLCQALLLNSLCWCNAHLTDGFIPEEAVKGIVATTDVPVKTVARMVEVGFWEVAEGGYQIHDYLDYQLSAAQVQRERAFATKRKQKQRHAVTPPEVTPKNSVSHGCPVPVPIPIPTTTTANAAVVEPPPPEIPEWLHVLAELQEPSPADVKRLTAWATTHDPAVLRETAFALVQKWPEYVDKHGNKARKPFPTFQNWVRMEENRHPPSVNGGSNGVVGNDSDPYLREQQRQARLRAERPT